MIQKIENCKTFSIEDNIVHIKCGIVISVTSDKLILKLFTLKLTKTG
jgi:hypothetical protein